LKDLKQIRFLQLDALRGLAAFAVMIFHYTLPYHADSPLNILSYGQYGVQLFFVISGFVIFMTLNKAKSLNDFVVSRFSRLYPTYWSTLLITFLAVNLSGLLVYKFSIIQLLVNMTMLQHWFIVKDIDGVYWTLTVELNFYIFMAIIYKLKLINKIEVVGTIILILMIFTHIAVNKYDLPIYFALPILHWWHLFFAGVLFLKLKNENVKKNIKYILISACLGIHFYLYGLISSFIVVCIFILFLMFTVNKLNWLNNRYFVFIGSISYALYLVHAVNGDIIFAYLSRFTDLLYVKVTITSLISIIIAATITYLVEKPSIDFIRRSYNNYRMSKPIFNYD